MVKTINKLYKFEKKVNEQAQEQNWSQEILHQERYKIRNKELLEKQHAHLARTANLI
jgi:hypothetical protein